MDAFPEDDGNTDSSAEPIARSAAADPEATGDHHAMSGK